MRASLGVSCFRWSRFERPRFRRRNGEGTAPVRALLHHRRDGPVRSVDRENQSRSRQCRGRALCALHSSASSVAEGPKCVCPWEKPGGTRGEYRQRYQVRLDHPAGRSMPILRGFEAFPSDQPFIRRFIHASGAFASSCGRPDARPKRGVSVMHRTHGCCAAFISPYHGLMAVVQGPQNSGDLWSMDHQRPIF